MEKKVRQKRIGDLQTVTNKDAHWAANLKYNFIRVQDEKARELYLLFTDAEIVRAKERADKNLEDIPYANWIRDLFD